jgi:hypothetical protein
MSVEMKAQRRLEEMAGLELGWRLHVGELLAWVVTGLALVMSYHAEEDLGNSLAAFQGWPAYVWPLSVDLADVVCIVLYLEYRKLRLATWKVVLGLVAATAVMIAANVRSVWGDWTAVAMQAWVPAIALWLWHTLAAGRKPRGAPLDLREVWSRVRTEAFGGGQSNSRPIDDGADQRTFPVEGWRGLPTGERDEAAERLGESVAERNRTPRTPARVVVRELLKRHGQAVTAERVMKRTGVSKQHANRLLREERGRRPHVVDGADAPEEEARR